MAAKRVQTRRSISFKREAYDVIRAIAEARGEPMSAVVERAIGEIEAESLRATKEG